MSVNSLHHWLVIRRCSCMFDFNSCIRMLELVLLFGSRWSARPWILSVRIQAAILWIIMIITWLIHWMAATMPESIHWSSLDGCAHTLDLDYYVLCYGWLRPYHIYHVLEISVVLLYAGSPAAAFSVVHVRVKHFAPRSLGPHALGGICYTVICHHPCYSSCRTLEDLSQDLWEVTKPKNTCIMFPWVCTSCSLKTPPVKYPWKVLFSH